MAKKEESSPETQDEHSNISKGSRIIGVISIILGVIAVVLSQTYYDHDITFLVGGIFLIIIGSTSVLLS
jgi:hypothetical protein